MLYVKHGVTKNISMLYIKHGVIKNISMLYVKHRVTNNRAFSLWGSIFAISLSALKSITLYLINFHEEK